jgi:hypothetical protein
VGSLCFKTVSAVEKRASIWCDHPIKYCGRRCNGRAHAISATHPTQRICVKASRRMSEDRAGEKTCQLKRRSCRMTRRYWAIMSIPKMWEPFTPCRAPCLATPERLLSGMSHNRRPMSMTPANNPNPIRRMADHGWHAPLHAKRVSSGRPYWGTGIANGCGNARYLGLCRAAVAYGLPKRAINL